MPRTKYFKPDDESENSEPIDSDPIEVNTNIIEPLLEGTANQLAHEFWRQLPSRVISRIQQMRHNPTPEDAQIVRQSFEAALGEGTLHLLPNDDRRLLP